MIELAHEIFSREGLVALVLIGVLVILGLMTYAVLALIRQKNADDATVSTQATVIAQLVAPIKEIADKLATVADTNEQTTKNLIQVVRLMGEHDIRVANMREMLDGAVASMHASAIRRDDQMSALPQKVREEMAPDFERLPLAIEEALAPKIEALKSGIEALITSLAESLTTRIDSATDEIPNKTNELVRGELAQLRGMIEQSLVDMLETAKQAAVIDDTDDPGADSAIEQEKTNDGN